MEKFCLITREWLIWKTSILKVTYFILLFVWLLYIPQDNYVISVTVVLGYTICTCIWLATLNVTQLGSQYGEYMTETNNLYSFGIQYHFIYKSVIGYSYTSIFDGLYYGEPVLAIFYSLDDQVQLKFSVKPNVIVLLWMYW